MRWQGDSDSAARRQVGRDSRLLRCCRGARVGGGYVKRGEYELQFADVFDQIVAYAAGTPINVVYPRALQRASERR